jgi:hypothetical protein
MNKKEFTKLFRELQKIQLSLLYSTKLSSDLYTNCNLNNTSYISMYLFVLNSNRNITRVYSYNLYSNDSIDKNKVIIDEIKQKVKQFTAPLRGNKRSEAERSDALIK